MMDFRGSKLDGLPAHASSSPQSQQGSDIFLRIALSSSGYSPDCRLDAPSAWSVEGENQMRETSLSDWTPIAYFQREEARRHNEQNSARAAPPEQERPNSDEKQLSGVTVASMQRRFLLLEQRLAILEQRERERQIREKFEVAAPQSQSRTPNHNDASNLADAVSGVANRREDHAQAKAPPEFSYVRTEKAESTDEPVASDAPGSSHASDFSSNEKKNKLPKDFVEIRPSPSGDPVQAGWGRRMAAAFSSFVVTAFMAGSIGFIAAILAVPAERAAQFHAFLNIAVNAISDVSHRK